MVNAFRRMLTPVSLGIAALALLSFAPAWWWWALDLVASVRMQLALLLLALSALAFALHHRLMAVGCGLAFVVSAAAVMASLHASRPSGTALQDMTVITANLGSDEAALRDLGRLSAAADADLVLLSEAPDMRDLPDAFSGLHLSERNGIEAPGLVVLSRLPFDSSRVAAMGPYGRSAVVATVTSRQGPLSFVAIHAPAPVSRDTYHFQKRYLQRVARLLLELPAGPVVVAGDFSNVPWSRPVSSFASETGLEITAPVATWPAALGPFGLPIDYLVASPGICVTSLRPVELAGTDHAALVARLGICPPSDASPAGSQD